MPAWINAFRKVFGGGDDNVSAAQAVKDVLNGKGEVHRTSNIQTSVV